jgi:nitrogen regulatory protein PII-like uncharacterized protein
MIKNFDEFISESAVVGKGNYFLYIKPVNKNNIEKLLERNFPGNVSVKYIRMKGMMVPNSIIISNIIDKNHAEFFVETISEEMDIEKYTIFTTRDEDTLIRLLIDIE